MDKLPATAVQSQVMRTTAKRRVFRRSGTDNAAALIGHITAGDEICGITNGQFSLVDMIEHVLNECGPSDVCIATWTMGIYDTERSFEFIRNKLIRSIRFVLDPSMFSRRPEIASILVKGFGVDAFRAVNSHAKFATIRGDTLAVCIRSSMNLNPNNRIESFDISVCEQTTAFFESLVNDIWAKIDTENRSQSRGLFDELVSVQPSGKRPNPFRAIAGAA